MVLLYNGFGGYMEEIDVYEYYQESLDKYGITQKINLTKEETIVLYHLCELAREEKFPDFLLTFLPMIKAVCLFKNPENKWCILESNDGYEGYVYGSFNGVYEACLCLIKILYQNDERSCQNNITLFNNKLKNKVDDKVIEDFVRITGFNSPYTDLEESNTLDKISKEYCKKRIKFIN